MDYTTQACLKARLIDNVRKLTETGLIEMYKCSKTENDVLQYSQL